MSLTIFPSTLIIIIININKFSYSFKFTINKITFI